jgi:hypothetical protein
VIPSVEEIVGAQVCHVLKLRLPATPCDERRLARALDEARSLAADRVQDEPAALLFALTRHLPALGARQV